jgi:flagellar basal body-associated protein FliL
MQKGARVKRTGGDGGEPEIIIFIIIIIILIIIPIIIAGIAIVMSTLSA